MTVTHLFFSLKICKKSIVKTCGHTEFKSIPFLSLKLFKNKLKVIKTKYKLKLIMSIIFNFGIYVYSFLLNTLFCLLENTTFKPFEKSLKHYLFNKIINKIFFLLNFNKNDINKHLIILFNLFCYINRITELPPLTLHILEREDIFPTSIQRNIQKMIICI